MNLYYPETLTGLILITLLGMLCIYVHYIKKNESLALALLILTALILRLFMIQLDPFLNNWDERYHALVAKNMMEFPFKPMLRAEPILPFKMDDWSNNHVWVHKQPLFMWQMALSMKIFGINEIALRLPSAIMGAGSVYFVYKIGALWIRNNSIAFLASIIYTFSYFQLELCSGRIGLEHNDLCFAFYFTAAIWSFLQYLNDGKKIKWVLWIGVFIGAAILVKWLTALLLFGGWGLYISLQKTERFKFLAWKHLLIAMGTCLVLFLPWQIYISQTFPVETDLMHKHNLLHITEALGILKPNPWYHLKKLELLYHPFSLVLIPFGISFIFSNQKVLRAFNWTALSMILVLYFFFSIIVQTKMQAYTVIIHSIMWLLISSGVFKIMDLISNSMNLKRSDWTICILSAILMILSLKPLQISAYRAPSNEIRNVECHNASIYKNLESKYTTDRVIINVKELDDVELMYYQDVNVYHWYPTKSQLDSLLNKGYNFSAFINNNGQPLPDYITENNDILIIPHVLQ